MSTILIFTDTYLPLSETFVYQLNKHIKRHKVVLVAHESSNLKTFPLPETPLEIIPRNQKSKANKLITGIRNKFLHHLESSDLIPTEQLQVIVEKYSVDVIVAHFCNNGIKVLPATRQLKLPLIVMAYGCDVTSWPRYPRYKKNLQVLFNEAQAFIPCSNYLKQQMVSLGAQAEKIHANYLAPPKRLLSIPTNRDDKSTKKVTFLQSGRLVEKKGILYTLKAFASALKSTDNIELRILGDGELREPAEELCQELGISKKVCFLGAQEYATVIQELQAADVFALHSMTAPNGDTEGGPTLAVQEAMALGLPIVSTRHADIPYVIKNGENGFLTDEQDIDATAKAFLTLANDPELRIRMGKRSREIMEELNLTAEAASERFEDLVDRALS